jgi:hypothetical protein
MQGTTEQVAIAVYSAIRFCTAPLASAKVALAALAAISCDCISSSSSLLANLQFAPTFCRT